MAGVDQQAWKDPLRLRSEGQWSHEMSWWAPFQGSLQTCPQAMQFPSISETPLGSTSGFPVKGRSIFMTVEMSTS